MDRQTKLLILLGVVLPLAGSASAVSAAPVPLQNATATYSQSNPCCGDIWSPRYTIDGQRSGGFVSWAPNRVDAPDYTLPETIVWETQSNLAVGTNRPVVFGIWQEDEVPRPGHNLGRFRLSYTTDNRSLFADGLATGGDVSANWTVIDPLSARSSTGESFTKLADKSLLVSGGANTYSDYFVTAAFAATDITGFRLEALADPSLPSNGPGRFSPEGFFHVSEFEVTVTPIPAALPLLATGLAGLVAASRLRQRKSGARLRVVVFR